MIHDDLASRLATYWQGALDRLAPGDGEHAGRVATYWRWFGVALFVLIVADMITTVYAAAYVGPAGEANPLMRWALGEGLLVVTAVNVVATVLAVGLFYLLVEVIVSTPSPWDRVVGRSVQVWLGCLIAVGLGVVANNLLVIVAGRSLI